VNVLSWNDAVDIGGGRGRLAREAAASLARVDAAFGHPVDINEAWRSPEQANANYARYIRYLNGGPWAPIALPADSSVHCVGFAVDTDDTSDAQMRIWNEHGWYWTVYRDGKLAERWHLEYFRDRDKHRNDAAPAGGEATPIPAPVEPPKRKKRTMINAAWRDRSDTIAVQAVPGGRVTALKDPREWAGIQAATGAEYAQIENSEMQAIFDRFGKLESPAFDTTTGAAVQVVVPLDGQADRYQWAGDRLEWIDGDQLAKLQEQGARTQFLARDQIERLKA
jgi:hypothetical protein